MKKLAFIDWYLKGDDFQVSPNLGRFQKFEKIRSLNGLRITVQTVFFV